MRALKKELMSTGSSERARRRRRRMRRKHSRKKSSGRQSDREGKSFPLSWSTQKAPPFESLLRPEGRHMGTEEETPSTEESAATEGERDLARLLESAKQRLAARSMASGGKTSAAADRTPLPLRETAAARRQRPQRWSERDFFKRTRRRRRRRWTSRRP